AILLRGASHRDCASQAEIAFPVRAAIDLESNVVHGSRLPPFDRNRAARCAAKRKRLAADLAAAGGSAVREVPRSCGYCAQEIRHRRLTHIRYVYRADHLRPVALGAAYVEGTDLVQHSCGGSSRNPVQIRAPKSLVRA